MSPLVPGWVALSIVALIICLIWFYLFEFLFLGRGRALCNLMNIACASVDVPFLPLCSLLFIFALSDFTSARVVIMSKSVNRKEDLVVRYALHIPAGNV